MDNVFVKKVLLPLFLPLIAFFLLLLLTPRHVLAATLGSVKDTISTSRPSASSTLNGNQAASASQVTIDDNGSIFLASDSATLWNDTGETLNTVTVASLSAANTPSSNKRIIYFVSTAANTHHTGDPITTAISAMHTVQFTIPNAIPSSGKIVITFPGSALTTASPSASTFSFNGLTTANASANISYKLDGSATCTFAVSAPAITCTTSAAVAAATTITFLIGCADASTNETSCTTQSPRLINPTKTAAAGTADSWTLTITTQDSNSVNIDSAKTKIGTIESVEVTANVDPTLTFTIAGIANATAINTGNTTGCTNTENTSAGNASTATAVDLGTLGTGAINIAAQLLTITTNAQNGYTLTATSSGHLINPATGFWITDSTTPTVMTAGTTWFGVHPCGLDVTSATWATGATGGGANAKYAWPTQTGSVSLASDATGPIANSITAGNGLVSMEYAATISVSVPAGSYQSVITYVVTATF